MNPRNETSPRDDERPETARAGLALIPAILAGLILRRSGMVPTRTPQAAPETPGHERSDVHAGATGLIMLGLALAVALSIAAVFLLDRFVTAGQRAGLPPTTAEQRRPIRPPAPNLQAKPYDDIDRLQARETGALSAYAYRDAARTRARIPLDRAMALTVGRPLDP